MRLVKELFSLQGMLVPLWVQQMELKMGKQKDEE